MAEHQQREWHGDEIAVVGMAGHFSKAADVEQFWKNIRDGMECITYFTDDELREAGVSDEELANPKYVRAKGILDDTDMFDAGFFGYSPREATIMDPQSRHFLEVAWTALEHAGYDSESYERAIGVYAGGSSSGYMMYHAMMNPQELLSLGMLHASTLTSATFIPTWTAYKLNLRGPAIAVNTACSTALVAIHMAGQSLLNGECGMALAGGTAIHAPTKHGYTYDEGGISSDDGHTKSFDADAKGTITGSGAGVVVLKRLEDALADGDTVYAVIKGSAINNDGSLKIGFTAPSVDGQAEVIAEAQAIAGVEPETIGMIECHGSATPLGDPIEVAALTQAFRGTAAGPNSVAIGSVKSNLGHCDTAAGIAGFLKTVQALRHRQIPASLNYSKPNPQIDFAAGPFYVNTTLREWDTDGAPRRAGVSSFGIGGTNAHVILEEPPELEATDDRPWQLVVLSARTPTALDEATRNLVGWLRQNPDANLADTAWTLQAGRRMFAHRRAAVVRDAADAAGTLAALNPGRVMTAQGEPEEHPVVFLLPGEGALMPGLGAELYADEEAYRQAADECAEILKPLVGTDIRALCFPTTEEAAAAAADRLSRPSLGIPAACVWSYALAKLWMHWGIEPDALVGHGVGEYVAAALAGTLTLEEALGLAAERGRLMDALPEGSILIVGRPEAEVRELVGADGLLLSVEGPALCMVAAAGEGLAAIEARLAAAGAPAQKHGLQHAPTPAALDEVARAFGERAARLSPAEPAIPFVSSTTGTWITAAEVADPGYWVRQLREPVLMHQALAEVFRDASRIVLEMGPGMLATQARQHPERAAGQTVAAALMRGMGEPDRAALLKAVAALWLAGRRIDWKALHAGERRRRIALPTYPFERRAYALGGSQQPAAAPTPEETARQEERARAGGKGTMHPRPNLQNDFVAPRDERETAIVEIWQELFGIEPIGVYDNFFELGGHSLLGTQVVSRVRAALDVDVPVRVLFEGPTVADLAAAVARSEGAGGASVIQRADAGEDAADLLARLDDLSEEEMEALLAQMAADEQG